MANENFYSSSSLAKNAPTNEAIAARAYELWVQQGCPHGNDEANWYEAERQLVTPSTTASSGTAKARPTKITKKDESVSQRGVPLQEEVTRSDPDSPFDDLSEDAPLTTKVERDIADFGDSKNRRSPTST